MRWRCLLTAVLVFWLVVVKQASAADLSATMAATPTLPSVEGKFFGLPRGNRWIALGLSLSLNGLGQIYNNQPDKGFGMMASWLTFPVAYGFDALTGRAYGRVFSYTINLGVKGWSCFDAFEGAVPTPAPSPRS